MVQRVDDYPSDFGLDQVAGPHTRI